jgi:hypothetical protein
MSQADSKNWLAFYQAALLETDGQRLNQLIQAAQLAIDERFQEVQDGRQHSQERQALIDATQNLRILCREALPKRP